MSTTIPTTINKIPSKLPTTFFTTIKNKISTTSVQIDKLTTNNNVIFATFPTTSLTSIQDSLPIITIQETINKTKEELLNNLDEVLEDYDISKIYEILGNDYNIKISPIN